MKLALINFMTLSRILLAIVIFLLLAIDNYLEVALVLFMLAGFTDYLDGYLARKYSLTSLSLIGVVLSQDSSFSPIT